MILLRMVLFRPEGVLPAGGNDSAKKPVEPGRPELRSVPAQPQPTPTINSPVNNAPVITTPVAVEAAPATPVVAPKQAPPVVEETVDDPSVWWAGLVAELPMEGMLRNLAEHASLGARNGLDWTLLLEQGHQMLATPERLAELGRVVSERLGSQVRLNAEWREGVENTPAQQIAVARQAKILKTRELISQDPVIIALQREFGGQLDIESIQPD